MNYLIVKISADAAWVDTGLHEPRYLSVDGSVLTPGIYASAVMELPASQTMDGRPLARGFYAILWPMDERAPQYEESPLYFGPFLSRRKADALVREASADAPSAPDVRSGAASVEARGRSGRASSEPGMSASG